MKKLVKRLLVVFGMLLIAFPFASPIALKILPQQLTKPLTNNKTIQQLSNVDSVTPFPPSTYVAKTQKLLTHAQNETDPKKAAKTAQKALETTNEGLMFYSDSADLFAMRATVYELFDGNMEDAILFAAYDYKKAYELAPQEKEYGEKAYELALSIENYDQAIESLTTLHQATPTNPEILLDLAQTQAKGGYLESAIASYTKLIKLLPSADTKTIAKERDVLVNLIGASLENDDVLSQNNTAIGGVDIKIAPLANEALPDELIITSNTQGNNPYQTTSYSNALTGEAVLTSEETAVTVKNTNVTDATVIYITPTSDTDNEVLYVSAKRNGSFTVSVDNSLEADVTFKWWIKIN